MSCTGSEKDRSGKAGVDQPKVDLFFDNAKAYASWNDASHADTVLPLGANTSAAAGAIKAVLSKVEDYFARCRLAAFDPRAVAAVNLTDAEYTAVAAQQPVTGRFGSGFIPPGPHRAGSSCHCPKDSTPVGVPRSTHSTCRSSSRSWVAGRR